ncbi:ATPase get3 [Aureobasidium pullulans]|nr:ATPase get3 [Aureobasidium pullulans]
MHKSRRSTEDTTINMAALINTDDEMAPSLQNILDQKSLRWIFVGGKGGVGKTTTSCSLAIQLAKHRKNVLLISTDPAHNLSDAFNQKFGKDARLVNGFDNLSAMEIDPNGSITDMLNAGGEEAQDAMSGLGGMGNMMQDLAFSIPGVDEAMSFAEVLKQVKSLSYECIIFDTAPTGHTLRFLQFPTVMEKALGKISQLSGQFGPMLNGILGARGGLPQGQSLDDIIKKMEDLRATIGEVNTQFKNADLTTFVCVCIPEFLSLYETERMIQELNSYEIDTHAIVVNQLLFPKENNPCEQCNSRRKMQKKYLEQIEDLYDEFNVVKMPLLVEEVRGKEKLENPLNRWLEVATTSKTPMIAQVAGDEQPTLASNPENDGTRKAQGFNLNLFNPVSSLALNPPRDKTPSVVTDSITSFRHISLCRVKVVQWNTSFMISVSVARDSFMPWMIASKVSLGAMSGTIAAPRGGG